MTPQEFDSVVEQAKTTKKIVGLSLAEERERLATEEELAAWEGEHSVVLPPSYHHFARVYGCGGFVFITVLSVLADSSYPISPCLKVVGTGLVPVIDNHRGDYYCFPVVDGKCEDRIVFADHEVEYEVTEYDNRDFLQFVVGKGLER